MKLYLIVFLAIAIFVIAVPGFADCDNEHCGTGEQGPRGEQGPIGPAGPPGPQGEAGVDGVAGVNSFSAETLSSYSTENHSNGLMAGSIALDQIDFGTGTEHLQVGVGFGHYQGENAAAVGLGKLLPNQDVMLRGSMTYINSDIAIGGGLTWKIR